MSIPKLIHQSCARLENMPQEIKDNMAFIKANNPGWTHRVYDNDAQLAYIKAHISADDFDDLQNLNPKYAIVRTDLFRYLLMYHEGGVYFDDKSRPNKNLDEVIKPEFSYIICQWHNRLGSAHQWAGIHQELAKVPGGEFQQWHIAAAPKHPFLKAVIEQVLWNIKTYTPDEFGVGKHGVLRLSGPICYTLAIWPLLNHYPANILDGEDLGFQYSLYDDVGARDQHAAGLDHYSRLREPILLRGKTGTGERQRATSLGTLLARELQDNTDLALKIALFAVVSTATLAIMFPLMVIWMLSRPG